ncbi:MAG: hypothetical protein P8Q95_03405 [Candidatus Poseidoniaceae archaeon]|nr:hypothetical protein [Candidatus Poseidoniaceae archaeon]
MSNRITSAIILTLLMLLSPLTASAQISTTGEPEINALWILDENGNNAHAYRITFYDNSSFDIELDIVHLRDGIQLDTYETMQWSSIDSRRVVDVFVNTSLEWGDQVTVTVDVNGVDGQIIPTVTASREMDIGTWNQPMDDHEIMLSTIWDLDQSYENEEGEQGFFLNFEGQGWQKREGQILNSWELGNGSLVTIESTNGSTNNLSLILESIWKNETIVGGVLTTQIFDARGYGVLNLVDDDGETQTHILANVSDAWLNRSMIGDDISERLRLEATGVLNVSSTESNESSTNIDGEVSIFYLETWDENGIRRLQDQQFEALAELIIIDDGTRLDISVDGLTSSERWEDGIRTMHKEEIIGSGTFGFEDQDNESSIAVNGTIYDFHSLIEDGQTKIDDIHVDGDITGDVQGTFGIVRYIEETGQQVNASGVSFLVNVIHEETWFNLTGINGGNFFDGAGIGSTNNNSWNYQAVQSDWDNRTVRLVWEETGADASSGDDYPENSPLQDNATAPQAEDGLGNITISRETGLMPIPMIPGDNVRLDGQEGLVLQIIAESVSFDPRDGHNFHIVSWSGQYEGDDSGYANGAIIDQGPLKGLLSSVNRTLEIPYGENNESAFLNESQTLERVLSPSIVTLEENSAPVISEISLQQGLVIGEGGSTATLIANITDVDWNIDSVLVDLTPIGGEITEMNDRGLNGDQSVGDDLFTTLISVPGLETGLVELNVTATDKFGVETTGSGQIEIINQAPRLTSVEILPNMGYRGAVLVVNAQAYDGHGVSNISIDLRNYGGDIVSLAEDSGIWAGQVMIPEGMAPGFQSLDFILEDGEGKVGISNVWYQDQPDSQDPRGPHFISDEVTVPVEIKVLNSAPEITVTNGLKFTRPDSSTMEIIEVQITDSDGISNARAQLGVFAPLGSNGGWTLMYDDGTNGDRVANDGIFSVEISLRTSTPLGTHDILVQAADQYDVVSSSESMSITVEEDSNVVPGLDGTSLSTGLLMSIFGILIIAIIVVSAILIRNKEDDGSGGDRFGFE